uniref:Si:ch1073-224n8.1 n=1 Tax=Neogobius melanostomus TaxID=47308 RepID=A0A8C6T240_9GOBI
MERDPQNQRGVSGPDLGLGGSVHESLQGFGPSNDYKLCQLSIQPDGSVTNHSMDSFGSNTSHMYTAGPSGMGTAAAPTADRPHHCIECGKTFRLISSLKKHIRIHTGEKPYPCGVCGRRFRESGALKTHLRIHTGEKPYSCSECGNCFRHLDGLRKHRRTHTGEKPYVCGICGKRLSRLQHLKHHQLIHTGERPCCCPYCNRTFKEPAALRKHVRTHRDEGGHMDIGANEDQEQEPIDDINNLHPAAPSPQMRFDEWGTEEENSGGVDCV